MKETPTELRTLFGLNEQLEPRPWRWVAGTSVAAHLLAILFLREVPIFEAREFREGPVLVVRNVTPLYAPVMEPTQKEANKGRVDRDFDVDSLKPRPQVQVPQGPPSTTRPAARMPAPVPAPVIDTPKLVEPPKIEQLNQARGTDPAKFGIPDAPPPPKIEAQEKPKLAFESVGSGGYSPKAGEGDRRFAVPSPDVSEVARSVMRERRNGGLMLGDVGEGEGGMGSGINLPPSPGTTRSNLELLSDPQGVDFRPYLVQVLATVRRNWFAVIPESARIGIHRGRVIVQFAIDRQGKVPKLVISVPSGAQPLDRAAVAGISASNPFPPLPAEFKGEQVRLQFTFSYNMAPRR